MTAEQEKEIREAMLRLEHRYTGLMEAIDHLVEQAERSMDELAGHRARLAKMGKGERDGLQ